ncbi:MAG: hypothetical protein ACXV2C_05230 [Candidatus Bathyarchaeia archaeon]
MTAKPVSLGIIHKILILFVVINIIGDIGNVAFWWANSSARDASLNTGIIGVAAGVDTALIAGTAILLVVALVYIVSLFGLLRKMKWSPLLIVAISVANRALALFLYFISPAFAFWAVWTVILLVLAYLDYKKIKTLIV